MWRSRTRASRCASARRSGDASSWVVARMRAERRVDGVVSCQFSVGRLDADDVAVRIGDGDHIDGVGLAFGVGGAGAGAFELDLLAGELAGGFVEVRRVEDDAGAGTERVDRDDLDGFSRGARKVEAVTDWWRRA